MQNSFKNDKVIHNITPGHYTGILRRDYAGILRRGGVNVLVRLAGMVRESVVDGPGLRTVVFFQGCPHHCPGCHNPETWDSVLGILADSEEVLAAIGYPGLISGVTFSGGEPFQQSEALAHLAKECKRRGFHIMVYTGYLWEQLLASTDQSIAECLTAIDLLVDGPFVEKQKCLLPFRGSSNQRIINVPDSLQTGKVITDPRY